MLTFRKFAFRSSVAGSLALLSAALLHTSLVNSMSQSGSASALDSIADSAIAHVDSTISSISAELPYQIKAIPHQAGEFLSRNATTARLQFEGMKNSITAHLGSGAWLGGHFATPVPLNIAIVVLSIACASTMIFIVPRRDVVVSEALIEQAEEEESGMLL